ncbi:MAG: hypothetical protein RLO80_05335 [Hyphomonas sp.]
MTPADIVLHLLPLPFAGLFVFGPGLKWLTARLGNSTMAIGLFGFVLCAVSVALWLLFMSPAGKETIRLQIILLSILGAGNLLLFLYELFRRR